MLSSSILATAMAMMLAVLLGLTEPGSAAPISQACTDETMTVRKEWSDLTREERKEYTAAVNCLMDAPSQLNNTLYPGAVNRYADFIAIHINYTFTIHLDAVFLPWHRNYVRLYEQALQDECDYKGAQPYWDWPNYVEGGLQNSTIFDGSPWSMGSDGRFTNESLTYAPGKPYPSGSGGGCVYKGPFSGWVAPFQQFDSNLITNNVNGSLPSNAFDHLPHCFSRNLNNYALTQNNNYSSIETLLSKETIGEFQNFLSGPLGSDQFGPHGGGHFAMGGEGSDLFTSPTDPVFFLHHAQVDRMWTIWQAHDPKNRQLAISGTKTLNNVPPSDPLTLEDYISWGPQYPDIRTRDLMSATGGDFCYRYE